MLPSSFSSPSDHSLPVFTPAGSSSASAPVRIEDRGTYQAQQRFVLGISRAAEECAEFYIRT